MELDLNKRKYFRKQNMGCSYFRYLSERRRKCENCDCEVTVKYRVTVTLTQLDSEYMLSGTAARAQPHSSEHDQ